MKYVQDKNVLTATKKLMVGFGNQK